jgi:hypothetical protein
MWFSRGVNLLALLPDSPVIDNVATSHHHDMFGLTARS